MSPVSADHLSGFTASSLSTLPLTLLSSLTDRIPSSTRRPI
jgi:hypothetical protein